MALYRLPAGTDVAEMALFDIDALPHSQLRDAEGAEDLIAKGRLIRLPTDGDGGYLLHLYVNESPPEQVTRYYQPDDTLAGTFTSTKGRVGFGGIESAFQGFKPNHFVRSDAAIAPGEYSFTAYKTDIPDEDMGSTLAAERTFSERWLSRAPLLITLSAIGIGLVLAALGRPILAIPILILRFFAVKVVKGLTAYKTVLARREEAELNFPSIVIEMRPISREARSTSNS